MKKAVEKVATKQSNNARKKLLEELFQDFYTNRWSIYRLNFIRGLAFGFGSVLGGTIVVALLIYLLSFLAQFIPPLDDFFESITQILKNNRA